MLKKEMNFVAKLAFCFAMVTWGALTVCAGGIGGPGISASPPVSVSNLSGLGTGVGTALGINVGSAGAPVVLNGALGTPSSGNISSCTSTSMVLTTPILGTPTSGTLTNCTIPIGGVTGGTNHNVATFGASGIGTGVAPGTSGNVLTSNGTDWTSAAASGGATIVYKAADQTKNSNTTFADDNTLTFSVSANTKYAFEVFLIVNTNITPSFKYQFTGPASPTNLLYTEDKWTEFGSHNNNGVYTAFSSAHDGSCATGNNLFVFRGVLENGSNAGSVTLQWAQNVSNAANTTVKRGSFIRYQSF